jgi:hypothetical protein
MNTRSAVVVAALIVFASGLHSQIYPLGQQTPGANPQTSNWNIGWEFRCNAPGVIVVELGCNSPQPLATTATLFDVQTQGVLAQVPIPAGSGWRFVTLPTSVPLVNGSLYRIAIVSQSCGHHAETTAAWKPTGTIQYTAGAYVSGNNPSTYPSSSSATSVYGMVDIGYVTGPTLTVAATAGTAELLYSHEQGAGGIGVEVGSFTISSNNQTPTSTLSAIDIKASGTGDDSVAISEVYLYRDDAAGASPGVFDPADIAIGGPSSFAADDGTITFGVPTAEQGFALSETRVYFVVVKLAGIALPGETFDFTVSDIIAATGSKTVPANSTVTGFVIDTPQFIVLDDSLQTPATVVLGTSGICQEFTVDYPAGPDNKPSTLSITSLGTANEATDLSSVELWWDSDSDGALVAANDTLVDSTTFAQDNGTAAFNLASHPDFQAPQTRRYFVVYVLNANGSDQQTFKCYVSDIGTPTLGGAATGLPAPGATGTPGLEISAAVLTATLNGPLAAQMVYSNAQGPTGDGVLLCDFTLAAAPGGTWTINDLTFAAAGTGQHDSAYNELALYEDLNSSGTWDGAATDASAATALGGFTGGSATFALALGNLTAGSYRRFFLVGKLNGSPLTGETFNARLDASTYIAPTGGVVTGVPTADSAALVIDTAVLTVANSASQPGAATHKAGAGADYLIAGLLLTTLNDNVTVNGIALTAAGTGDWASDVDGTTGIQVYLDDGNSAYDAADTLLYQGAGAAVMTATFSAPLNLPVGTDAELWIRIGLTATAGQGRVANPETFSVTIANPGAVNASSTVLIGTPAPASVSIGAIEFEVSSFAPSNDLPAGGKAINMSGKGFMTPFTVTIGGVVCPGTPSITGGTQVTGLIVPPGGGQGLVIEVASGTLPPQTLTQTFSYSKVSNVGSGGDGGGSGCTFGSGSAWVLTGLLLGVGIAIRRTRRS